MKKYFSSLFCQRYKILWLLFFVFSISSLGQSTKPKNIVIMIGDGMGTNYVSASVIALDGDPFKKFTSVGLSVTCSADKLITDSAAGGTAIATGYRTNNYSISINPSGKPLKTIFEHAEELNKSTGVVVTSSVTHATPATFLSHIDDRNKENEIAEQIVNGNADIVIGGGTDYFKPENAGGGRKDNINLVDTIKSKGFSYFETAGDLFDADPGNKIYALLDSDGLLPAGDRDFTLGELTKTALNHLSRNPDGFVLMVEGSQIDWAGHSNDGSTAMKELEDFNTAVNVVLDFIEENKNTLLIITADHETGGMSINGGSVEGDSLQLAFTSGGHTAEMVGVFAKGPGEELFSGVYDNYMIGRKLFQLLDEDYQFLQ